MASLSSATGLASRKSFCSFVTVIVVRASGALVAPPRALDSGRVILTSTFCFLKVVVAMKKMRRITMMSISDTMGMVGTGRRRGRRFISGRVKDVDCDAFQSRGQKEAKKSGSHQGKEAEVVMEASS